MIAAWVDTLRAGDVEGAAELFAIPSTAVNGGLMLRIRSTDDAVAFNESLPCGAELIRAEGMGETVTATFRLTERPGPGTCGDGTGRTGSDRVRDRRRRDRRMAARGRERATGRGPGRLAVIPEPACNETQSRILSLHGRGRRMSHSLV